MRGDRWCKAFQPFRGGYTCRPKNWWRPVLYVRATLRSFDVIGYQSPYMRRGYVIEIHDDVGGDSWPMRRRSITLKHDGVAYQAALEQTAPGARLRKARACIVGTGYPLNRAELLLRDVAERARALGLVVSS